MSSSLKLPCSKAALIASMLAVPLILYMYGLEPKPPIQEILGKQHKLALCYYDSQAKQ